MIDVKYSENEDENDELVKKQYQRAIEKARKSSKKYQKSKDKKDFHESVEDSKKADFWLDEDLERYKRKFTPRGTESDA